MKGVRLKTPVILDGHKLYDPAQVLGLGFEYGFAAGRASVRHDAKAGWTHEREPHGD
jgi:hypothetical protein